MRKHNFGYFLVQGVGNMFSHGFMSFVAIGITVACLLIMGTFTLVAVNADLNLKQMESENEILAYVNDAYSPEQAKALQTQIEAIPNVTVVTYISREEATRSFQAQHEDEEMFRNLDPAIFRDRYAIHIADLRELSATGRSIREIDGIDDVNVYEEVAGGFITVRNVATVVCVALIAVLFLVSVFIISNTIKLTTFDRREEIAIMRMVGATNSFIRGPFLYEGFLMGLLGAAVAFLLQWSLYEAMCRGITDSDTLQLIKLMPFEQMWKPVAAAFAGTGILIGVGGSMSAISKFLRA